MESHSVPQNVTDFEFHLVGDMTLKQFTYLATGVGLAYALFAFLAQPLPFIAWPLIVFSSITGVAFAFLPIQERPLDHWVAAFFKAVFSPTKINYKAPKGVSTTETSFYHRLDIYLSSTPALSHPSSPAMAAIPTPATAPIQQIAPGPVQKSPVFSPTPQHQPNFLENLLPHVSIPQPKMDQEEKKIEPAAPEQPKKEAEKPALPTSQDLKHTVQLAKEAQNIHTQIVEYEHRLDEIKAKAAMEGADPQKFVSEFQKILADLQQLNKKATDISHQMAVVSKQQETPQAPVAAEPVKAKIIPTMTLTTIPNIINGIVTDAQNNYVDGAIIVAHDRQGLPVRALKSNKLGQFIAATPLPNGKYTLSMEKDNLIFDVVEVELQGDILKPIVVSAKKQERAL